VPVETRPPDVTFYLVVDPDHAEDATQQGDPVGRDLKEGNGLDERVNNVVFQLSEQDIQHFKLLSLGYL
jgi:hypothetical protein